MRIQGPQDATERQLYGTYYIATIQTLSGDLNGEVFLVNEPVCEKSAAYYQLPFVDIVIRGCYLPTSLILKCVYLHIFDPR